MRLFTINGKQITDDSPAYVIAECSHNHNGSVDLAREMFRVAKQCGADAVKLQKRSPAFYRALQWRGLDKYASVREQRELDLDTYGKLRQYARSLDLDFIVTTFDEESLRQIVHYNPDAIKAASAALRNLDLMSAMARTGFPLIISTGCTYLDDIKWAMDNIYTIWTSIWPTIPNVALLQCTSTYPTADNHMHLRTIESFRTHFPRTLIGLSSHHQTNLLEPVAYALGARIFEKHFTLSKELGEGDHAISLEPRQFAELVANLRSAREAIGSGEKAFLPCEEVAYQRLNPNHACVEGGVHD